MNGADQTTQRLPAAKSSVQVQQQGDEVFLVDTELGEVFLANATTAVIFEHCRLGATFQGAARALAELHRAPHQESEILTDVQGTVHQLVEIGFCK